MEAKAQLNYVTGVTYGGKLLHGYLRAGTGIGGDPSVGAAIRVGVQEPDIKALPFDDKVSGTSTHLLIAECAQYRIKNGRL